LTLAPLFGTIKDFYMTNYIFSYERFIDKFPVEKKRRFLIKDKKLHKIKGR
jgi:hypothetical protein